VFLWTWLGVSPPRPGSGATITVPDEVRRGFAFRITLIKFIKRREPGKAGRRRFPHLSQTITFYGLRQQVTHRLARHELGVR